MTTNCRPAAFDYRTCPMSTDYFVNRLTDIEENDPAIKEVVTHFKALRNRPVLLTPNSNLLPLIQRWHAIAMQEALGCSHPLGPVPGECLTEGPHRICYSARLAMCWVDPRLLNYMSPDSSGRINVCGRLHMSSSLISQLAANPLNHRCPDDHACPMLTHLAVNHLTRIEVNEPAVAFLLEFFSSNRYRSIKVEAGSKLLHRIQVWDNFAMRYGLGGHPLVYTACSIVGHHLRVKLSGNEWIPFDKTGAVAGDIGHKTGHA
ncbi:hypothetical protein HDU98_004872 [Podochytrium sp. JEL0797]|nr:hypothetical protein HDU98_004872 [Podochytrium sp. JEL0797]